MPVTPYHFGPGLALAAATRRIDFWAFAAANVLIDLESGWNLWRGQYPVHGFFHTFVGAALVIVPAALLAFGATALAARFAIVSARSTIPATAVGAALGAGAHVVLDAIMHRDVRPFAPWSAANPLLDVCSLEVLHRGCLIAGIVGLALFARTAWLRRRRR